MRLDRVNLAAIADVLQSLVEEAISEPGRVARLSVPTSPSDGVQVFVRATEGEDIYLALRRPGGKEDPREILALARHMGLVPLGEPERRYGKDPRPPKGPRAYLVLRCAVDPFIWEGKSMDEVLENEGGEMVVRSEDPGRVSSGSPGQASTHEDAQKTDQESIQPQDSFWPSTDTLTLDEVEAKLKALGYKFCDWSRFDYPGEGAVESYRYVVETNTVHLAPWLPVERIYQGFSELETPAVSGKYLVSLQKKGQTITAISFGFSYTFTAKRDLIKAEVRMSGPMNAPFPHGRPTEHDVWARLYVGPVPMGKGQKARARQAMEEALRSIPSFVHHFPEAKIVALLETRGGRGGWKTKVAHHDMGQVKEWLNAAS